MHFSFPVIVNLELNRRCNLRCVHCYIGREGLASSEPSVFDALTEEQIKNLLGSLHSIGVFLVVLTGGEPFLNGNIENVVRMASEKGFVLEVFSNLQHLPDWLSRSNPNALRIGRIQTSVYSADPRMHDKITMAEGSFERTLTNLRLLKERGYYVEVATPLMRRNFETRNETVALFRSLGIRQDFAWPIVNEYQAPSSSRKALLNISGEQVERFATEHPDFFIRPDLRRSDEPICAAGRALLGITCDGDVWPCSQYPLAVGNILERDVCQILGSPAMLEIAGRTKAMLQNEDNFNFCMGTNYAETGDPFSQPDFVIESTTHIRT